MAEIKSVTDFLQRLTTAACFDEVDPELDTSFRDSQENVCNLLALILASKSTKPNELKDLMNKYVEIYRRNINNLKNNINRSRYFGMIAELEENKRVLTDFLTKTHPV